MKINRVHFYPILAVALIFAFGGLCAVGTAQDKPVSKTAKAGEYSVTLKVLPAESFTGPHHAMVHNGGAAAVTLKGAEAPNHHLVVFIEKNGAPVEHANVRIEYRELGSMKGTWENLPVARMYVAGKGVKTTHYGNNLHLAPGKYEARVTVNGKSTATYRFAIGG
ncbi:MAG TPA: hypothetical protein VMU92_01930 [Acidobacteriaceae bacterium]|nr:hypothetical protein [Acidobacteriaceae bacterium]